MSSMYIKWLIFPCDLLILYPIVHFLRMWESGIIAIPNSNGDSASLWNMFLWNFTSAKLLAPAVDFTHQVSMVFSINFTTLSAIIIINIIIIIIIIIYHCSA